MGSGGNVGAVLYGIGFRSLAYNDAFLLMGSLVIASSFLSLGINIPCHAGLIWGEDNNAVIRARERYLRRREGIMAMTEQQEALETVDNEDLDSTGEANIQMQRIAEENEESKSA